jgi:hypothetical protein
VVKIPKGTHRLSLYFFNKDGHEGKNRFRDYLLEVRCYKAKLAANLMYNHQIPTNVGLPEDARSQELTNAIPETVLARARVRDFWGGVYKTFAVQGPGDFYVRIARHGSHNAIVSAVLTDKLPEPVADDMIQGWVTKCYFGRFRYAPPDVRALTPTNNQALAEPLRLWDATQNVCTYQRGPEVFARAQTMAYRTALRQAPKELADNWRWHLHLWDQAERLRFTDTMTKAWAARQDGAAHARSAYFSRYSPNVVPFSIEELLDMERKGVNWRTFLPTNKTNTATLPNKGEK